ncbi:hypothetical protein ANO11243_094550 [Dothideomycetidae sp. 11243]|nr:hypothetical protein ANO11243_094550 [fungal sp. No.11243]
MPPSQKEKAVLRCERCTKPFDHALFATKGRDSDKPLHLNEFVQKPPVDCVIDSKVVFQKPRTLSASEMAVITSNWQDAGPDPILVLDSVPPSPTLLSRSLVHRSGLVSPGLDNFIQLLVYEPATLYDEHREALLFTPLPADKTLWNAADAQTWTAIRSEGPQKQTTYGMTVGGELVTIQKINAMYRVTSESLHSSLGPEIRGPEKASNWGEWCSDTDSLGTLVMLAASSP